MKNISLVVVIALLLVGCAKADPVMFDLADLNENDSGKSYNFYVTCVSRAAGNVLWPEDVLGDKTVEICREVIAPNAECASALGRLADAVANSDATLAMVNGTRDRCEPHRAVGEPYVKAPLSWGVKLDGQPRTEQEFWDNDDFDLKNESATRQRQRTAFQKKMLPQIRQCYETANASACYAILTAETILEDGELGQGYLTDYVCTYMVGEIINRQALHNQPGFVIANSNKIPDRPNDKGNFFVKTKAITYMSNNAQWCNMELRKSGLPELK